MSNNIKKIILYSNHDLINLIDKNENNFDIILADISKKNILFYLKNAVKISIKQNLEYLLISTENHTFTKSYQKRLFENNIREASNNNCHILCGGLTDFYNAVAISPSLAWIDRFINSNYLVIFNSFYHEIMKLDNLNSITDLNDLTVNKMVVFPFISIHKNLTSQLSIENNMTFDPIKVRENNALQKLELYIHGFKRFNL